MPDTTAKLSQHKGQKPRHQLHSVRGQLHIVALTFWAFWQAQTLLILKTTFL